MKEGKLFENEDAKKVRRAIAALGIEALTKLSSALKKHSFVTEEWAKTYKIIADQLRRDYRVEEALPEDEEGDLPAKQEEAATNDPLVGLKLLQEEDVA